MRIRIAMKIEAKVIVINEEKGFVAAATDQGELTVFEPLGCEKIALGDVVFGYLDECGTQSLYNETRDEQLSVYIFEYGCLWNEAHERYFESSQREQRSSASS